jgi:hypothetical protein
MTGAQRSSGKRLDWLRAIEIDTDIHPSLDDALACFADYRSASLPRKPRFSL